MRPPLAPSLQPGTVPMSPVLGRRRFVGLLAGFALAAGGSVGQAHQSGRRGRQVGKASIYSKRFAGRTMADGTPMAPHKDNAASKTLPLGTRARVTNLETGESAVVTIRDRGPHVPGRIIDLSPATADQIGLERRDGVATVEVAPLHAPGGRRQGR